MGLFAYYLRVFFRSHARPIRKNVARRGELISSVSYVIFSAAALTAGIYYSATHPDLHKDSPYASGKAYTIYDSVRKFSSDKPSTVIKITGLKVEKEIIEPGDEKLKPIAT